LVRIVEEQAELVELRLIGLEQVVGVALVLVTFVLEKAVRVLQVVARVGVGIALDDRAVGIVIGRLSMCVVPIALNGHRLSLLDLVEP
jgi:hypothetical protein